jgi:cytochrome c-type biogenesis protein
MMTRRLLAQKKRMTLFKGLLSVGLLAGVVWGAAAPGAPCAGEVACERPTAGKGAGGEAPALPGDKPHLVEFVSTSCPSCARMAPIVDDLDQRCTGRDGTVVKINVDTPGGEAAAERFRVKLLPTFVSVDAEGREVERHEGEIKRDRLSIALAEIRGQACL